VARVAAASAALRGDATELDKHAKEAGLDRLHQAQWLAKSKNLEAAEKLADQAVNDGKEEVPPLALLVDILWRREKKEEALKRFEELRKVAHSADLDLPIMIALAPVAKEAAAGDDWRIAQEPASDTGERPTWDKLGPESWQPYAAEPLFMVSPDGDEITGDAWEGKPRLVIFYLGAGCLHCVEQLKTFAPRLEEFRSQGIDVFAVSNESTALLKKGLDLFDEKMPIPLFTDPEQMAFMSYRCWDDFESIPLHGTYLIDSKGRVRWQDIGPEPFNEVDFLLNESTRLLNLP
jgi:peroxiredoxin